MRFPSWHGEFQFPLTIGWNTFDGNVRRVVLWALSWLFILLLIIFVYYIFELLYTLCSFMTCQLFIFRSISPVPILLDFIPIIFLC